MARGQTCSVGTASRNKENTGANEQQLLETALKGVYNAVHLQRRMHIVKAMRSLIGTHEVDVDGDGISSTALSASARRFRDGGRFGEKPASARGSRKQCRKSHSWRVSATCDKSHAYTMSGEAKAFRKKKRNSFKGGKAQQDQTNG